MKNYVVNFATLLCAVATLIALTACHSDEIVLSIVDIIRSASLS